MGHSVETHDDGLELSGDDSVELCKRGRDVDRIVGRRGGKHMRWTDSACWLGWRSEEMAEVVVFHLGFPGH